MSKATGFLKEFRDFAVKGNAIDLAVGVIIGAAFGKIVDSIVKDLVMPLVNFILGGSVDFTNKFLVLSMPKDYTGPMTYADLSKAGANVLAWGNFHHPDQLRAAGLCHLLDGQGHQPRAPARGSGRAGDAGRRRPAARNPRFAQEVN